jgi:hypothetical protein
MSAALKSRLAKIARITAKIAGAFIAFVLLLCLVWAVINSFDVPLSDQAKALLAVPPNPFPSDQNIYLAIAGMEGAGERTIIEMGLERIEAYNQTLDPTRIDPDAILVLNKQWDAAKLKVDGKVEELGHPRTSSIWTTTKTHRQAIAALLASNQQLYRRYLSLHSLHGYYETAHPSFTSPVITPPQSLRTLFLADVANRIQTGTPQQQRDALNDLQQDLQLWRTVLKGDGTLISKMLSVAFLHTDMILLADLITDSTTDLRSLEDLLDPIVSPFDSKDYRIGNAFAAEFRTTTAVYKTISSPNEVIGSMASSSRWNRMWNAFQAHFFKLNATENMSAILAAQWVELGNSEPGQFYINRDAYHEWLSRTEPHLSSALLYNPIGNTLVKLAVPQREAYPLRVFDVAAYQRLVYLVFQLKRQHIATADVTSFLKAHPEWSTHPVDGSTFHWNAQLSELAVNTLGEHSKDQRFSVILR